MDKRISYLDALKGVGILLMIMGHLGFGEMFSKYIHAFNMPLFFIISGYLFDSRRYQNFKEFLLRKMKSLLIPYFFFGILHIFIAIMTISDFDIGKALRALFLYNNSGLAITGVLWFLTSLFFAEILFYLLEKYLEGIPLFIVCFVISALASCLSVTLPYSGRAAIVAVGFLYVGYWMKVFCEKRKNIRLLSLNWCALLLFLPVNAIMILANNDINMRRGMYGIVPLFWLNAIVASIIFWNLCKKIDLNRSKIVIIFNTIIKYIGNYSIIYLCLNELIIKYLQMIIDSAMSNNFFIKLIIKLSSIIFILLLLTLLNELVKKTKIFIIKISCKNGACV